ncbi:MULE domain-containing protein [Aphis craccivora]|uniref:MULE domain-containing protein n=1 Tax=Aphis craccivora TaxID=307492 RepID=A0A6G0VSZ2_APHCR|nr:MULE domain-containing protein [Aphis craccivora]
MHVAINKVWPSARLRGCRFHFWQAWFAKIKSLGLDNGYENEKSEIGKYLKNFFGLPFLNPPDVNNAFTNGLILILPQDYRVECFTDYILKKLHIRNLTISSENVGLI